MAAYLCAVNIWLVFISLGLVDKKSHDGFHGFFN